MKVNSQIGTLEANQQETNSQIKTLQASQDDGFKNLLVAIQELRSSSAAASSPIKPTSPPSKVQKK